MKFQLEIDNVQTSNVFNRFKIPQISSAFLSNAKSGKILVLHTDFICTESQREQTNLFFFLKFNLSHKLQLLDVQHNFCSVMCYTVIIGTLILLTRCMECSALIKSALPSDTRVNCDKTRERSVQVFISYERSFSLVF